MRLLVAFALLALLAAPAAAQDAAPDRYYGDLADAFEQGWDDLKARRGEIATGMRTELTGLAADLDAAIEANTRIGTYADWHRDWLTNYRQSADGFGWMFDLLLAVTGGGAAVVAARALTGAMTGGAGRAGAVIASGLKRAA